MKFWEIIDNISEVLQDELLQDRVIVTIDEVSCNPFGRKKDYCVYLRLWNREKEQEPATVYCMDIFTLFYWELWGLISPVREGAILYDVYFGM